MSQRIQADKEFLAFEAHRILAEAGFNPCCRLEGPKSGVFIEWAFYLHFSIIP
jgi:hypothetical protein